MTVDPATITGPPAVDASARFVPTGQFRGSLEEFDYVEEEWFASGEVDGHPYTTALTVRRPRDPARFSGTVLVEPIHAASAAPIWIYTSMYQMRHGHGWAAVCSQKSVLDAFVKPTNAERYAFAPDLVRRTAGGGVRHGPAAAPARAGGHAGEDGAHAAGQRALDPDPGPGRRRVLR